MENNKVIEILNDLIQINNDRIAGYEKATENIDNGAVMLKTLFYQIAEESQEFKKELKEKVKMLGGDPASDTTTRGKIYRLWMDVKVTFAGDDARATLESCEFGEEAAQRAYVQALEEGEDLPAHVRQLIEDQKSMLLMSYDLIKSRREEYKELTR